MPWMNFHYPYWLEQHKLSQRNMLQPLFEAIENAFNAVEESGRSDGLVEIKLCRDLKQKAIKLNADGDRIGTPSLPVCIHITDNGVGFSDANWAAFETLSTPYKKSHGGKGMGRLSYLLTFKDAQIESTFCDGPKWRSRSFTITRAPEGTSHSKVTDLKSSQGSTTTLKLNSIDPVFHKTFPKKLQVIADKLVIHFFRRLSFSDGIKCTLSDDWDDSVLDLQDYCKQAFVLKQQSDSITILDREYTITHVHAQKRAAERHEVHFCGNGRVVFSRELPTTYTGTKTHLTSGGQDFYYAAFLEGPVLNAGLRDDRLSFTFDEDDQGQLVDPDVADNPCIRLLRDEAGRAANSYLKDVLFPLETAHRKRIEEYCRQNVIFRPLLKHRMDALLGIRMGLSEELFEQEILKVYQTFKADVRKRFSGMAKSVRQNNAAIDSMREKYQEALRDFSELAYHELAAYVVDRRAVIDFLSDKLKRNANGKFCDEDAIHDIFFPRRHTSDDLAWDESNLWLIDERLSYQQFVASDIELRKHGVIESDSKRRPDLTLYYDRFYDLTFAFSEGDLLFTSVTLVEFKKPERTSYDEDENPAKQVIRYIREIRANKSVADSGHVFRIHPSTPIHVHIICHIVAELEPFLSEYNYVASPDGQGIVFQIPRMNALIQITTFEKLIADAKKRNEVFFRKLGINYT